MSSVEITAGELTAVIGDNAAVGEHRAGYNGLWSLRHTAEQRGVFVPGIAGLNHEHIFDGETDDSATEVFFEPRHAPMSLRQTFDRSVELHQPPTTTFHLESWSRFSLTPPHYVDFEYRCAAHQHVFHRGYIGLFWANYIHAPEDKSIYFRGALGQEQPGWMQLCSQKHNDESTVRHREERFDPTFRPANRESLFRSLSPIRYDKPFFYGHFEDLVLIFLFDRTEGIRFAHSPSGGGFDSGRGATNPAWDFQYIVPRYEVMKEYGFRARVAVRPRCSRVEIESEFTRWSGSHTR